MNNKSWLEIEKCFIHFEKGEMPYPVSIVTNAIKTINELKAKKDL